MDAMNAGSNSEVLPVRPFDETAGRRQVEDEGCSSGKEVEIVNVFVAEVIDIREESRTGKRQRWQMMLNQTEFSAVSCTGTLEAISRSGARLQVPVLGVVVEGDCVWHQVEKPLAAGTSVTGRVGETATDTG